MKNQKSLTNNGLALIYVTLISSIILLFLIFIGRRLLNFQKNLSAFEKRQKSFYLAQAGSAAAQSGFKYDPDWKPTDPPFSGNAANLIGWLVKNYPAGGSTGRIEFLAEGGYKIIWETGKNYFYSVGFLGPAILNSHLCILKITFDRTDIFQIIKKEEI